MLESEILGWDDARQRYSEEWEALIATDGLNPSVAPEWAHLVLTSMAKGRACRALVAREDAKCVGFLPFYMRWEQMLGLPVHVVEMTGNLVAYHQEIVAPGRQVQLLRELLENSGLGWDVFIASAVDSAGPTAAAIRKVASAAGPGFLAYDNEESPYIRIDGTWEEFLASRSRNFRSNLGRKDRLFMASGEVEERWLNAPADVDELFRCMIHIESKSWKQLAGVAVGQKPRERRYYHALLPYLAERGYLFANVLYVDGQPAAYHLCYRVRGVVGNLKTSFQEQYGERSPGVVVIARAIQRAFEDGADEFNFHGGKQQHKTAWTDHMRDQKNYFLFSRRLQARMVFGVKRLLRGIRTAPAAAPTSATRAASLRRDDR